MKKLLLVFALLAPATLFAQTPFDGTWITKLDTAQYSKKPNSFVLNKGHVRMLKLRSKIQCES